MSYGSTGKCGQSIQFSCTPCIVVALTDCETSKYEFSRSLQTLLLWFRLFVPFTVFELFRKNWFDAINFEIS